MRCGYEIYNKIFACDERTLFYQGQNTFRQDQRFCSAHIKALHVEVSYKDSYTCSPGYQAILDSTIEYCDTRSWYDRRYYRWLIRCFRIIFDYIRLLYFSNSRMAICCFLSNFKSILLPYSHQTKIP